MKHCRLLLLSVVILATPACQSPGAGTGKRWYNPTTWFSGSEGAKAAKTEAKLTDAKEQAIDAAKVSVHETQEALAGAPASRQVEVAKASNDNAVALLDQVAGPLTAKELAAIREKIRLLTSELAEERARGELLRKADTERLSALSDRLAELTEQKAKATADLAAAFVRENSLANELRNERWWSWFWRITLGLVAVLALAGFVYVRLTLGGLPTALGKSLTQFRTADPDGAARLTGLLDINTTPAEQSLIRLLAAKHS